MVIPDLPPDKDPSLNQDICHAAKKGDQETVKELMIRGADPSGKDRFVRDRSHVSFLVLTHAHPLLSLCVCVSVCVSRAIRRFTMLPMEDMTQ